MVSIILSVSLLPSTNIFANNLGDRVGINTFFRMGDYLLSQNGQYKAIWQHDGNFVVYRMSDGKALWATNTSNIGAARCAFEDKGNLVVREPDELESKLVLTSGGVKSINVYKNQSKYTYNILAIKDSFLDKYISINVSNVKKPNTKVEFIAYSKSWDGSYLYKSVYVPKTDVIWHSPLKYRSQGWLLIMQNDGNLVIYDRNNTPLWACGIRN